VNLSPLDPSHHFKKAVLFQQQGMVRESLMEFVQVLRLAPDSDVGLEARQAIEAIDHQQMRQIVLLASEDVTFRTKLRRDAAEAATEKGFCLSEMGESMLQSLDFDALTAYGAACQPAVYH
jgi:hypothetical protein